MGRRQESGVELLSWLPWPVCLLLGLVGFIAIDYVLPWWAAQSGHLELAPLATPSVLPIVHTFGWVGLGVPCVAALLSFARRHSRHALLSRQSGMESIAAMDWRQFEQLVGEAYRRQGYAVVENGQGGADGGIDLRMRKDGREVLVQCKQWRRQQVGVSIVREMFGVLTAECAQEMKIVALGSFTEEARRFARAKPIELVDGRQLLAQIVAVQAQPETRGFFEQPHALVGGLVLVAALAWAIRPEVLPPLQSPAVAVAVPVARMPALASPMRPIATPMPDQMSHSHGPPQPASAAGVSFISANEPSSTPRTEAELRAWEAKNRAAMAILDKTTPEVARMPAH